MVTGMRSTSDDVCGEQQDENRTWDSFKSYNTETFSKSDRKYENWHKFIKVIMRI